MHPLHPPKACRFFDLPPIFCVRNEIRNLSI